MMTKQEQFLATLQKKGNDKKKFDAIRNKATVQLYRNGFKVITSDKKGEAEGQVNNASEVKGQFYTFNKGVNQALFNEIMEGKLPIELLEAEGKESIEWDSAGVVIEDYSKQPYFEVILKEETVTVSVKQANGKIFAQVFNMSHTLGDVVEQVASQTKCSTRSFSLLMGYPPKEITEVNKTVKELNLGSRSLIQKMH